MLDLAGIPLRSDDRTLDHPLVIAGGPCAQNPEPIAPFIDVFVTGDGEPSLPLDLRHAGWKCAASVSRKAAVPPTGDAGRRQRADALARLAATTPVRLRAAVLRAGVRRRRHASRA